MNFLETLLFLYINFFFQEVPPSEVGQELRYSQNLILSNTKSIKSSKVGISLPDKTKSETNEDVDTFVDNESVDSYTLKNGDGFFSSLASLATEQVGHWRKGWALQGWALQGWARQRGTLRH